MDPERERIQADLRGLLDGEVRCDDVFLQLYASDASIYEVKPLGVVRPRGAADVVACMQYAAENEISVHARGAGSGLAGESLGPGLVLDFSHAMRRIVSFEEDRVRVQPGVVHAQLNRFLASHGRLFGPDPATSTVSTIGGVLALDSSGSRWLRYGSARSRVESLQVVLADGYVLEAGRHPVPSGSNGNNDTRTRDIVGQLADLLQRNADLIERHRSRALVDRCGYHLHDIMQDGQLDLARLLVGSEGTLGLITEATLRTDPLPQHRGMALLFFDRLDRAAYGSQVVAQLGVSACDLMDRRLLSIARESNVHYELLIPREAEALLLVEVQAEAAQEVRDKLQHLVQQLVRRRRLAFHAHLGLEDDDIDLYWQLARRVVPTLYRLKGSMRPLPFVEDLAVPPDCLPEFLTRVQNVFKSRQVTASLFAHAGHGQLHIRPFLDLADPEDVQAMQGLADELYDEVLAVNGTISGEHGDGLSRTWYVERQFGPLYKVFQEVKRVFDPHNILNPGKKVASRPQPLTGNLRPVPPTTAPEPDAEPDAETNEPPPSLVSLQLGWSAEEVAFAARSCNGCAACRTQDDADRMCPMSRFAPREEASPRAKANLVRGLLTGRLSPGVASTDECKAVADLCFHCHQCRLECPASVDIPKLMVECKAQYVSQNGLMLSDWFLTRLEWLASLGSWAPRLANWALANPQMRWVLERLTGIAQGRKLPRLARRNFLRAAHRLRLTRPTRQAGRKVLFFVDHFANWHDVQLAEALVAVFQHNGAAVYVPPSQQAAGMPLIALGAVEDARRVAAKNVALLAEAVRQGYHVVASEPTAALCLTHEYPQLLDDDDARLVARNSSEACDFLWRMHQQGDLELDFKPVHAAVGYHLPCHLRALEVGSPGENLLRLIPGLMVHRIEAGCSGMAGTFGMKRENYRTSLRAGWGLIAALRNSKLQVGASECSACKMQMEQGNTKPTVHPLKVLALAYGLMPELASLLTTRGEERIVT